MTIRVTVKNEDAGEDRVIVAQHKSGDGKEVSGYLPQLLKGGESAEFYVHGNNQIVVTEAKKAE